MNKFFKAFIFSTLLLIFWFAVNNTLQLAHAEDEASVSTGDNIDDSEDDNGTGDDSLDGSENELEDESENEDELELENAYEYAHTIGITTMETIEDANMNGKLIRSHMAKMMVNYAEDVLGKTPDTTKECEFTDTDNQSEEMKWYILEACQLGLMGVDIDEFHPSDEVTRAQFGTVLSRALWGDLYNTWDVYYLNHLNALKTNNIISVTTPDMKEIRWYVMIMLMRADK